MNMNITVGILMTVLCKRFDDKEGQVMFPGEIIV
jgi:hypothetical protein